VLQHFGIAGADPPEVLAAFADGPMVRAGVLVGTIDVDAVVLPKADRADDSVRTLVEREVVAARALIFTHWPERKRSKTNFL
jgi:hypothetical protein